MTLRIVNELVAVREEGRVRASIKAMAVRKISRMNTVTNSNLIVI